MQTVLDEMQVPLKKMLDLDVGDTIFLNAAPDSKVKIKCGEINLTEGRVGRMGHKVAVRIENPISDRARKEILRDQ